MTAIRFAREVSERTIDFAAQIWAEATATRDHDPDVAPLALARTVITSAVGQSDQAMLLTALDVNDEALGFALALPLGASGAELRFLGVTPAAWGRGVATGLLNELAVELRAQGRSVIQLWVYEDNERAVATYERSGWRQDGETRTHFKSGKVECLYVRHTPDN